MRIESDIKKNLTEFVNLCKDHKVKSLYAFGSSVTDNFDPDTSDIDLIAEINDPDPLERGELLMSFWDELEVFFQRKVDLLTERSIKNPFLRKSIEATKVLIYDGSRKEVII